MISHARYSAAVALVLSLWIWMGGCGGTPTTDPGGTTFDVWSGSPDTDNPPQGDPEPNDADDSDEGAEPGDDPVVAGDVEDAGEWTGTSELRVNAQLLNFGAAEELLSLRAWNAGDAAGELTIVGDVGWISAEPGALELAPDQELAVAVRAERAGLSPGEYAGELVVRMGSHAVDVALELQVVDTAAAPLLVVSSEQLAFGSADTYGTLELSNGGSGTLSYTVRSSADWLVVDPGSGVVGSGTDLLGLTAERGPLDTGESTATIIIDAGAAGSVAVNVTLQKPNISPRIVPWFEVNSGSDSEMEDSITAMRLWRRVTDVAVVSTTSGHAHIYPELLAAVPGMTLIPGIKTYTHLGTDDFDSLEGWELIAQDVEEVVAAAGEPRVLIENETALESYFTGQQQIDFDQLRLGLALLPADVQVIWYGPRMSNEWYRARSIPMIEAVQDVTTARIVGLSYGHPDWHNTTARAILDGMVELPTFELTWWECIEETGNCYWRFGQAQQMLTSLGARPDVLVYPPIEQWVNLAVAFTDELSP